MSGYKYNCRINRSNAPHKLKLNLSNVSNLPSKFSLRSKLGIPYDQLSMGSCTSNSVCKLYQYHYPSFNPSRLFLYQQELKIDGNWGEDAGSTVQTAFNALKKFGVPSEESWSYDINNFTKEPEISIYNEALLNRSLSDGIIEQNLNSIKSCLADPLHQNPISLGILLFNSFENHHVMKTGIVPMPDYTKQVLLGGHCILLTGYDDNTRYFEILNSWGENVGDKGYFYIPYDYILNSMFTSDLHTLYRTTHDPIPPIIIPNLCANQQLLQYSGRRRNQLPQIEIIGESKHQQSETPNILVIPENNDSNDSNENKESKESKAPKIPQINVASSILSSPSIQPQSISSPQIKRQIRAPNLPKIHPSNIQKERPVNNSSISSRFY